MPRQRLNGPLQLRESKKEPREFFTQLLAADGVATSRGATANNCLLKVAPMSGPNGIEIKLDRLINEMRLVRSQMIASIGA